MAGAYFHIPFCAKQCSYCDFYFSTSFDGYRERLLKCMEKEIRQRSTNWTDVTFETLYFGGGTPSLLTGTELARFITLFREKYVTSDTPEITLECNPDDCTVENLKSWKAIGITRLSIGLQSFDDTQLEWMNRTHTSEESLEAVKRAKSVGFDNITVDLMYGLPNLSIEKWNEQLQRVLTLDVAHISAYCLTIEERTPLAKWVKKGTIHPSTADQQSEQFTHLVKLLAQHGFEQYEISNFARNKHYSKHNTAYWLGTHYVGFGPSAHSYNGTTRFWNIANNQQYMQRMEADEAIETFESLTRFDQFNELLLTGLRTMWGVEKTQLFQLLTPPSEWYATVQEFIDRGLILETETHFKLTENGKLLADGISSDLFVLKGD